MTNAFTANPPAGQPPVHSGAQPAAPHAPDRWDWLRIGVFFWGMVFLLTLVPTILSAWYSQMLVTTHISSANQFQITLLFSIVDLLLPATLLITGSALSDRTFWSTHSRSRTWAIGRLALALGVIAATVGFALVFNDRIYQAFQSPTLPAYDFGAQLRGVGVGWVLDGVENGLILGVALAFVFRRLSQRQGGAWRVGLLGAALIAACALGLSNHLDALLMWAASAWMSYGTAQSSGACIGGSGAGCLPAEALTWVVAGPLPLLLALPLGALMGAPLAYPYDARQAREPHSPEARRGDASTRAQPQHALGKHRFWRELGRGAGSFAAGLLVAAAGLYAVAQVFSTLGPMTRATFLGVIATQFLPFGILGFIAVIRLARMPRERRQSARSIGALVVVVILGMAPLVLPGELMSFIYLRSAPNTLTLVGVGFSCTISLGTLLAVCWWPAMSTDMRRVLTTTLAAWLGFAIPLLLVSGSAVYQYATYVPSPMTCNRIGCGLFASLATTVAIQVGLIAAYVSLPLTLVGVWMGSWLLATQATDHPDARPTHGASGAE